MEKDFDLWSGKKKRLHNSPRVGDVFYYQREIWWCSIGVNIGVESDGKNSSFERPVLIIKKFNKEMFWGVPMTSKSRPSSPFFFEINEGGINSWAILSQLKTYSSRRLLRKISTIQRAAFSEVLKRLCLLITIEPPSQGKEVLGGRSP